MPRTHHPKSRRSFHGSRVWGHHPGIALFALALAAGCAGSGSGAQGSPGFDTPRDAEPRDPNRGDGGVGSGSDADAGDDGFNEFKCGEGMHACDGECIEDLDNDPSVGCRLGCGEPCPSPEGAEAYCTDEGRCAVDDCGRGYHDCGGECVRDELNTPERGCRNTCGDPCPEPEHGSAYCTEDGECGVICEGAYVPRDGECVCKPRTCDELNACGTVSDGCGGTLECGGCSGGRTCQDNSCGCPEEGSDDSEPNEHFETPHYIGSIDDMGDEEMTFTNFGMSSEDDVDWFKVTANDGFDFGNQEIAVHLRSIPEGHNYAIGAWFQCDDGDNETDCDRGTPDNTHGHGCTRDRSGNQNENVQLKVNCDDTIDDDGKLWIRVTATEWPSETCHNYTLWVEAE